MDLSHVGDYISRILDALDIKVLYIIIDEWMELEKRVPSHIQPYFAQMLKAAFFKNR